jgi:pimeloyl-ACP methyl ester carboxylesterase
MIPEPRVEGRIWLRHGRALGFAEYGDPAGAAILWFHGTPGGRRQVPPAARSGAAVRGIRLIALERPGVGGSTPHVYPSVLGFADDVEEVVDRLGIERFALIGLSGGGPYVLACAHRLRKRVVAGAVLGGVAPSRGDEAPVGGAVGFARSCAPILEVSRDRLGGLLWGVVRSLQPLSSQIFDAFIRIMPEGDQRVFNRPEIKEMFIDDLVRASRRQLLAPIYDIVQFTRHWGFSLREIQVPIRFWHGDADNIVPLAHAQQMAALVPGATLRVRPGEGHIGNLAAAEEVLEELISLWPSTSAATRIARRQRPARAVKRS